MYQYISRTTIFLFLFCILIVNCPAVLGQSRSRQTSPQQKNSDDEYTIKSTITITVAADNSGTFLDEILIPLKLSSQFGFVGCDPNQRIGGIRPEWRGTASIQPRGAYCEFKFSLKFSNLDMLNDQFVGYRGRLLGVGGMVIQEETDKGDKDKENQEDEKKVTIRITRTSKEQPLDPYTDCRVIVKIAGIQSYTGKEIATYDEKAGQIAWDFPKVVDFKQVEVSTGSLIYGRLRVVDPETKDIWNIDKILQSTVEAEKTTIKVISKDFPNSPPVMELKVKENGKFSSRNAIKGSEKDLKDGKEYILRATLAYKDYSTIDTTNNLYIGKLFIDRTGGSPPQNGYIPRNSRRDREIAIDRDKSTEPVNIDYPLPIVLIHGIRSYWDDWKWFTAHLPARKDKNSGLFDGFIVFTPTYKFRAGDKTTDTDDEIEQVRQSAVSQINEQLVKACGGLFSTRPKTNFICHSNGGIIVRVFSERFNNSINKIYTLGSPHSGSNVVELIGNKYGLDLLQMSKFNVRHKRFNNYVFAVGGNARFGLDDGIVAPQDSVFSIGYFTEKKHLFPSSREPRLADRYNKFDFTRLYKFERTKTVPFYHSPRAGHPNFLDEDAVMIFENIIFPDLGYETRQANFIAEVSFKNSTSTLPTESRQATVLVPELIELQKNVPQEITLAIPATSELVFSILTNEIVQLIDPNQKIISLGNSVSYPGAISKTDYYGQKIITIKNPKSGNWMIRINATSENTGAIVGASIDSDWELSGELEKDVYAPSSKIVIRAAPTGNYTKPKINSMVAVLKNQSGQSLSKTTLVPSKSYEYVYEASLTAPSMIGRYYVCFEAIGTDQGLPFKQQEKSSFDVVDGSQESSPKDVDTRPRVSSSTTPKREVPPEQPRKPSDSFSFSLNGNLKTDVQMNAGDSVTLSANGSVMIIKRPEPVYCRPDGIVPTIDQRFGLIVKTTNQGVLLARITNKGDEKWIVVGSGKTFIAPNSGVLELQVNDKKYQDNEGNFDVKVKIDRVK